MRPSRKNRSAAEAALDPVLRARLHSLIDEGAEIYDRFDREVREQNWHPFVPGDYGGILQTLLEFRAPGRKFLEWGSATGVVVVMAELLGFDAYGIELDGGLVAIARALAERYESRARFVAGSFLPTGYRWRPKTGDGRLGTIGQGVSAYAELGHGLDDFDAVYAYPWSGEEPMMLDLMRTYGNSKAHLLLHGDHGVNVYAGGRLVSAALTGAPPLPRPFS
jgi:hypothetical protein